MEREGFEPSATTGLQNRSPLDLPAPDDKKTPGLAVGGFLLGRGGGALGGSLAAGAQRLSPRPKIAVDRVLEPKVRRRRRVPGLAVRRRECPVIDLAMDVLARPGNALLRLEIAPQKHA